MSDYDSLEFRHLKYIQAIAEERTFTGASARVNVVQSAISTQIKQLEDLYGFQIFSRDRDGVSLTPYGDVLLACARDLLQVRADVIDMLMALRTGEITPLKIGYSSLVEKRTLHSLVETTRSLIEHNSDLTTCIVERERLFVCVRSDDRLAAHESIPAHELNGKLGYSCTPASTERRTSG